MQNYVGGSSVLKYWKVLSIFCYKNHGRIWTLCSLRETRLPLSRTFCSNGSEQHLF